MRRSKEKIEFFKEEEISLKEFEELGGKILESYSNKSPKIWLCGQGPNKEIIDPPGTREKAIHYLNTQGRWEAGNPDQRLLEELKLWRSDAME